MSDAAATVDRAANYPVHPKNLEYPEIVTVTETSSTVEATEEHKLIYKGGAPKGTILVKKISSKRTTIRTTTPYTGTL